jgi:enoyl-CoA hydratase/carnithine racemase
MERQDRILQITFHTECAALKWRGPSHEQLGYAFADIARDQENRVVIMTGTGDAFCAEIDMSGFGRFTPETWDHIYEALRIKQDMFREFNHRANLGDLANAGDAVTARPPQVSKK